MKLKACQAGLSPACVAALNKLRPRILQEVLVAHLSVPANFGSSEFYVQVCDEADAETHAAFCEVRLTGVSVNDDRSANDFKRARNQLESIYADVLSAQMPGETIELTVTIMLDAPINASTLVEGPRVDLPRPPRC